MTHYTPHHHHGTFTILIQTPTGALQRLHNYPSMTASRDWKEPQLFHRQTLWKETLKSKYVFWEQRPLIFTLVGHNDKPLSLSLQLKERHTFLQLAHYPRCSLLVVWKDWHFPALPRSPNCYRRLWWPFVPKKTLLLSLTPHGVWGLALIGIWSLINIRQVLRLLWPNHRGFPDWIPATAIRGSIGTCVYHTESQSQSSSTLLVINLTESCPNICHNFVNFHANTVPDVGMTADTTGK